MTLHAGTSELVQMLEKGHHNVKIPDEFWDRLITWIDINAPFHGTWTEAGANSKIIARKHELRNQYCKDDFNPEKILNPYEKSEEHVMPEECRREIVERKPAKVEKVKAETMQLDLGDGKTIELKRIPAGSFSMGSNSETPVEQPVRRVDIEKPFFMGSREVTLDQFRQFDPDYLNGVYDMHYKHNDGRGRGDENSNKVVRGGSWHDRPFRCTSSYRIGYPPWQRVYHTGFRIIVED